MGGKFDAFVFVLLAVGYSVGWTTISSLVDFFREQYGPGAFLQMTLVYVAPSLPVLAFQAYFDKHLDDRFGLVRTAPARLAVGLGATAALLCAFPFHMRIGGALGLQGLLGSLLILGATSGVALGTTYQLVSHFPRGCTLALTLGYVAAGPLVLVLEIALRVGSEPSEAQLLGLFESVAGVAVLALLLGVVMVYRNRGVLGAPQGGVAKAEEQVMDVVEAALPEEVSAGISAELLASTRPVNELALELNLELQPPVISTAYGVESALIAGAITAAPTPRAAPPTPALTPRGGGRTDAGGGVASEQQSMSLHDWQAAGEPVDASFGPTLRPAPSGLAEAPWTPAGLRQRPRRAPTAAAATERRSSSSTSTAARADARAYAQHHGGGGGHGHEFACAEGDPDVQVLDVVRKIMPAILVLLGSAVASMSVFPFFAYIRSTGYFGSILPRYMVFTRLLADVAGRSLPASPRFLVRDPRNLLRLVYVKLCLVPVFFAYLYAPEWLLCDFAPLVYVAGFWTLSGLVHTCAFMLSPTLVPLGMASKAGAVMAFTSQLSSLVGIGVALLLSALLFGGGTIPGGH
ncbi:unnamed protein product [Pedinophyceae sp. YPF-701]|nr:unnamed protein product [Pedinophyceae sp. YPF-701]